MVMDAGVDWHAQLGAGWVARFSASPVFEASAAFLHGAAMLWKGRYGEGRLVGNEAQKLAACMDDLGSHWRQAALGRTPDVFPAGTFSIEAANLLALHADRRGYRTAEGVLVTKHPMAARRLGRVAVVAACEKIEAIRMSGVVIGDAARNDATNWEDRFERFGETSLGVPPDDDVPEKAMRSFRRYATYRTCTCFWASASLATHMRSPGNPKNEMETACSAESTRFDQLEQDAYAKFASHATEDQGERAAITSVMDHSYATRAHGFNYASAETIGDLIAIASFYTHVLLRGIGEETMQSTWSRKIFEDRHGALALPAGDALKKKKR